LHEQVDACPVEWVQVSDDEGVPIYQEVSVADASSVQIFIDDHHKQCVRALQVIALLADTGSNEYKERFAPDGPDGIPTGWRVAEAMREIANDVVGSISLPITTRPADEPAWVSRLAKGNAAMSYFVARSIAEDVRELLIYKRAMDAMAAQMVHPKMTGLEMAKMQLGKKQ
jgi:hypothetical protein